MRDGADLKPGEVFAGDFRVIRPLKTGGMGAVYVAEQLSTGKQRALKIMLPSLAGDARFRRRFELEARIGSLIESDHVVEVVTAGIDAATGMPYVAMELLRGRDLGEELKLRGRFALEDAADLLAQMAHALGAAARSGVVHRDLKPENLFLAESRAHGGRPMVKILDFGIAKVVSECTTRSTERLGTLHYAAPEQLEPAGRVSPATDVWAFGLIAYQLLTGERYWRTARAGSVEQLMREIVLDPIAPASERAAGQGLDRLLPAGFDAWLACCLARQVGERFPDAAEAMRAFPVAPLASPPASRPEATVEQGPAACPMGLTAPAGGPPSAAHAPAPAAGPAAAPGSPPVEASRPARRLPVAVWAAGIVLAAGLGAAAVVLSQRGRADLGGAADPAVEVQPYPGDVRTRAERPADDSIPLAPAAGEPTPSRETMGAGPAASASTPAAPEPAPHAPPPGAPSARRPAAGAVGRQRDASMDPYCMLAHPATPRGYSYSSAAPAEQRVAAARAAGCTGGSIVGVRFCCP